MLGGDRAAHGCGGHSGFGNPDGKAKGEEINGIQKVLDSRLDPFDDLNIL